MQNQERGRKLSNRIWYWDLFRAGYSSSEMIMSLICLLKMPAAACKIWLSSHIWATKDDLLTHKKIFTLTQLLELFSQFLPSDRKESCTAHKLQQKLERHFGDLITNFQTSFCFLIGCNLVSFFCLVYIDRTRIQTRRSTGLR
jgi:hypothetical protein